MQGSPHIIRTVTLDVVCERHAQPLALQQEVSSWASGALLDVLSSVLAGVPDVEEHVLIDSLEIVVDAGDVGGAAWRDRAATQLRQQLSRLLRTATDRPERTPAGFAQTSSAAWVESPAHFKALFFSYLHTGVAPWSLPLADRVALAARLQHWATQLGAAKAYAVVREIFANRPMRVRFLQACPPALVEELLIAGAGSSAEELRVWHDDLARLALADASWHFFDGLLEQLGCGQPLGAASTSAAVSCMRAQREVFGQDWSSEAFRVAANDAGSVAPGPSSQTMNGVLTAVAPRAEPLPPPAAKDSSLFIPNAGAILTAAFLPQLFSSTGLLEQGRRVTHPELAITLVHWLATGRQDPIELEAPLAKLLCGVALETALVLPDTLPSELEHQASELLTAMIAHWSILGSTSITGLRETFLQRPGKLTQTGPELFHLHVERRSVDVLLQHLPWNLGMVRHRFMPWLIQTDWV